MSMFDIDDQRVHLGDEIALNKRLYDHEAVEAYFLEAARRAGFDASYDVTACEPLYFKTLNYTTYAGLFIINPLQPELAMRQVYDSFRDTPQVADFASFVMQRYHDGEASKYVMDASGELKSADALVVLPGENKLKSNVCIEKLKWIIAHEPSVVFKPHPLTSDELLDELRSVIDAGESLFADQKDPLYAMMDSAQRVYTSHISESALYAALLEKPISPIDAVQSRAAGGFTHLNYFLFSEPAAQDWVNPVFSSPRSGVVHPRVDADWQAKIEAYLDYIVELRERFRNAYIQ